MERDRDIQKTDQKHNVTIVSTPRKLVKDPRIRSNGSRGARGGELAPSISRGNEAFSLAKEEGSNPVHFSFSFSFSRLDLIISPTEYPSREVEDQARDCLQVPTEYDVDNKRK